MASFCILNIIVSVTTTLRTPDGHKESLYFPTLETSSRTRHYVVELAELDNIFSSVRVYIDCQPSGKDFTEFPLRDLIQDNTTAVSEELSLRWDAKWESKCGV